MSGVRLCRQREVTGRLRHTHQGHVGPRLQGVVQPVGDAAVSHALDAELQVGRPGLPDRVVDQAVLADQLVVVDHLAHRHVRAGVPPHVLPPARAGQAYRQGLPVRDRRGRHDPRRHVVELRLVEVGRLGQLPVAQPGRDAANERSRVAQQVAGPRELALAERHRQSGERLGDERHGLQKRRLVVRQPVARGDLADLRRDLALHRRRQIGEQVVLDVRVQPAVEDAQIGPVLERHLLLEQPREGVVHLRAGQEVAGRADLTLVILVGGLVWAGVGEQLELAGVVLDEHQEQHRHVAGHPAEVVRGEGLQRLPSRTERLVDEPTPGVAAGDPGGGPQHV